MDKPLWEKILDCALPATIKETAKATGATPKEVTAEILTGVKNDFFLPSFDTKNRRVVYLSEAGKMFIAYKSPSEDFKKAITSFTDYVDMAEKFIEVQPIFYDDKKVWWLWDFEAARWKMVDETDIMNSIDSSLESASFTIRSKEKQEILESLRRAGRRNLPEDFPKTWIQFRNTIKDLEGDTHEPNPDYFCTNPIPWDLGESDSTPVMDKIFSEWVGEENTIQLKEIIAYCLLQDYPIHRWFALIGAGSNGKGKFIELIKRFLGRENVVSTSLERIVTGRFESSKMYKKLVCVMGETESRLLQRTDILKRATGGDMIPGEFKGKAPFDFFNYAKIIIASNSLPPTTDKTHGFYRRPMIIDFENTFSEERDVLADIPDEEYENLGNACVDILKRIIKQRAFTNEGTIDERKQKYEEKSNPVMLILNRKYEKDVNGTVLFHDFFEEVKAHLNDNKLRMMSGIEIGKILRSDGLEIKVKTVNGENGRFILGIIESTKDYPNYQNYPLSKSNSKPVEISENLLNFSNSGNSDFMKSWRIAGGKTRTMKALADSIGEKAVELLLKNGIIFEIKPGKFKPI